MLNNMNNMNMNSNQMRSMQDIIFGGTVTNPFVNPNMMNGGGGMNFNPNMPMPYGANNRILSTEPFNQSLSQYNNEEKKHLKKGGFFSVRFLFHFFNLFKIISLHYLLIFWKLIYFEN